MKKYLIYWRQLTENENYSVPFIIKFLKWIKIAKLLIMHKMISFNYDNKIINNYKENIYDIAKNYLNK